MNYLSFDVGIKNLAYCELDPEKHILQWGTINLNENPICDVSLRKKCDKQATYLIKDDCKEEYCCTSHSKKFKNAREINLSGVFFYFYIQCLFNVFCFAFFIKF